MLFGDYCFAPAAKAAQELVRDPANFNWTFIALLAIVGIMYINEAKAKNFKCIAAALALYSVHWFYEIINAVICHYTGYALWTVSAESTSFMIMIGVCWELSMMFAIVGFSAKLLPVDKKLKIIGINNRVFFAILAALVFSAIEIFLAWTPAFIWVYPWWGAIPVFITTYIPFFLAAYLIHDAKPKTQKMFIGILSAINVILFCTLVPLGII